MNDNRLFNPKNHPDLIEACGLEYDILYKQVKSYPFSLIKWDTTVPEYADFWQNYDNVPKAVPVFKTLITELKTIPSQEELWKRYVEENKATIDDYYRRQTKNPTTEDRLAFDTNVKARIYNYFWPSLTRDILGAAQLKKKLKNKPKYKVIYNDVVDMNARFDIVIFNTETNFGCGLAQHWGSEHSKKEREDKVKNRKYSLKFDNLYDVSVCYWKKTEGHELGLYDYEDEENYKILKGKMKDALKEYKARG